MPPKNTLTLLPPTAITKKTSSALTFDALVAQIQKTLSAGRARAEAAVGREKAQTYWETGRDIHNYLLKGEDRAKYGDRLFEHLAESLHLSKSIVHDMLSVYREFPIVRAPELLTWTDYQNLLRVQDSKVRKTLAKEAAKKNWTTRELEDAIRKIQHKELPASEGKTQPKKPKGNTLVPKKGQFFTYQIVRAQNMHRGEGGLSLDLGFRMRREIDFKGILNPKLGEIVQVARVKEDPSGDLYRGVRGKGLKKSDLYTYKAKAQTYYDADTFWVDVDFGFHLWSEQKLRLRGIDAAELSETDGRKAAVYVKKVLSDVPFIAITISGRDKFGRPLADIFYLPGTEEREKVLNEGKYLNQELLDLGLAERVSE